jgi:hypothetical protein
MFGGKRKPNQGLDMVMPGQLQKSMSLQQGSTNTNSEINSLINILYEEKNKKRNQKATKKGQMEPSPQNSDLFAEAHNLFGPGKLNSGFSTNTSTPPPTTIFDHEGGDKAQFSTPQQ